MDIDFIKYISFVVIILGSTWIAIYLTSKTSGDIMRTCKFASWEKIDDQEFNLKLEEIKKLEKLKEFMESLELSECTSRSLKKDLEFELSYLKKKVFEKLGQDSYDELMKEKQKNGLK